MLAAFIAGQASVSVDESLRSGGIAGNVVLSTLRLRGLANGGGSLLPHVVPDALRAQLEQSMSLEEVGALETARGALLVVVADHVHAPASQPAPVVLHNVAAVYHGPSAFARRLRAARNRGEPALPRARR